MSESGETSRWEWLVRFYDRTVLQYPWLILLVSLGTTAFFGYYMKDFRLDASSESIVLENDKDLRYYNDTRELFGSDDYIIVTVTPPKGVDLFSEKSLKTIDAMSKEFRAMSDVQSVTSILSVPLFHSPDVEFVQMANEYKTLLTGADVELARKELTASPLYKNYLISADGTTTAVQVTFKDPSDEFKKTYKRRRELRDKEREHGLTSMESGELAQLNDKYAHLYAGSVEQNKINIQTARDIVKRYEGELGVMHLGGVPMIVADMIYFVRNDIVVFGIAAFLLVVITLAVLFRRLKWVILPMACCGMVTVIMMGYMGYAHWSGTIVTSNFPVMLIVITLITAIHIVAHYQEIYVTNPEWTNRQITLQTVRELMAPCLGTSLTTVIGFGSLMVSGIRPLIDLGIIVSIGIMVAYLLLFIVIPAALMYFPKGAIPPREQAQLQDSPMRVYALFTEKFGWLIYAVTIGIIVICGYGITLLKVENRFIDYFRKSTEINAGMTVIDQRLGGTTPLEIVLEGKGKDFWLEKENLAKLREIHEWVDAQPESGKVISPDTLLRIAESVYTDGPVPTPILKLLVKQVPKEIQDAVVGPYLTKDHDQARISLRVQESSKALNRKSLVEKFDEYFKTSPIFKDGTIKPHLTGVFVLYNNMLQSLYSSQISSVALSYGVIWLMFIVLFRSIKLATIAFMPNIPPAMLTLGIMGLADIPLNILTIMIAGVSAGEAVDFALHYIHRFRHEYAVDQDYKASMYRCHNSIGRAMYSTTITTVVGFAIVCFSNFIPNVYFGLFTALALVAAFFSSMTLLPLLIISWKPFGPDASKIRADAAGKIAA